MSHQSHQQCKRKLPSCFQVVELTCPSSSGCVCCCGCAECCRSGACCCGCSVGCSCCCGCSVGCSCSACAFSIATHSIACRMGCRPCSCMYADYTSSALGYNAAATNLLQSNRNHVAICNSGATLSTWRIFPDAHPVKGQQAGGMRQQPLQVHTSLWQTRCLMPRIERE